MEIKDLQLWVEGYILAWNTNNPEDIGRLFTLKGRYYTAPYRVPWEGRQQIISGWLGRKDLPGEFEFRHEILGVSGNEGFIRGWTKYHDPPREYSNLWVVRLNNKGECEEFIEWWMEHEG
ncbi:nuclear transport factor 2 family protein [candidate division TA06 bacterium]|nr:nuclear transport factor 2 family protein [candidate division TA06 bacterium]